MITIGKLAKCTEMTTDTIRYYEKEKLLAPARKTAAGYRLYDDEAIRRLRFIRRAQLCGFSLTEIRELLALRNRDVVCCRDVRSVAVEKKLQVEHKIKALQLMSLALSELITICNDDARPLIDCPILDALENSIEIQNQGAENG